MGHYQGITLFCSFGERCREAEELYRAMEEAGVLNNTAMVFCQMNEPPCAHFRVGHASELAELEERICSSTSASIMSVQAVYVPADDLTDPSAAYTFAHLSASVVLSRKDASQEFYPVVDSLRSSSKMLNPAMMGRRHFEVAQAVRRTLAEYEVLKNTIAMLGLEELSTPDHHTVSRTRRLKRFLTQAFHTTNQFTGHEGRKVSLEETSEGCERILADEFDDLPERNICMIGDVEEVEVRTPCL